MEKLDQQVFDRVEGVREELLSLSHAIHIHPECCFEEHQSSKATAEILRAHGFEVEQPAGGLATAFVARRGSGSPNIGLICEYDALPEIGHACGHNIIAAAGVGAAIAAAEVVGRDAATITVVGTPAEEGGGGKVKLLRAGVFDPLDVAMMVHPAGADLEWMEVIALHELRATFRGVAAHAAAFPHLGVNALDGAVLGYLNVSALRQHIQPDERVHGVFINGGDKANIVPALASMQWYVRSGSLERLGELKSRVARCLEAGALAAGCDVELDWVGEEYAELRHNHHLGAVYRQVARALDREVATPTPGSRVVGSTDMGNVSLHVPAIHPMISVGVDCAIHTEAFALAAAAPGGDSAVIDGAKILGATAVRVVREAGLLDSIRAEFAAR